MYGGDFAIGVPDGIHDALTSHGRVAAVTVKETFDYIFILPDSYAARSQVARCEKPLCSTSVHIRADRATAPSTRQRQRKTLTG